MAVVDPYSPCPCGSEKKFKWCCQKVEAYAERAHRLEDNGQHDAALAAYDEGLAKIPAEPVALIAKVDSPDRAARAGGGREVCRDCAPGAARPPGRRRLALPAASWRPRDRSRPWPNSSERSCTPSPKRASSSSRSLAILASELVKAGYFPAALKHFELAIGTRRRGGLAGSIGPCFLQVQFGSHSLAQGLRTPSRTLPGGSRVRCASSSSRRWAGRATGSGTRPPRRSSCSPPIASPARGRSQPGALPALAGRR